MTKLKVFLYTYDISWGDGQGFAIAKNEDEVRKMLLDKWKYQSQREIDRDLKTLKIKEIEFKNILVDYSWQE